MAHLEATAAPGLNVGAKWVEDDGSANNFHSTSQLEVAGHVVSISALIQFGKSHNGASYSVRHQLEHDQWGTVVLRFQESSFTKVKVVNAAGQTVYQTP